MRFPEFWSSTFWRRGGAHRTAQENPVLDNAFALIEGNRGFVSGQKDAWASPRESVVEIESQWTARKRELLGSLSNPFSPRTQLNAPAFAKSAKGWATTDARRS